MPQTKRTVNNQMSQIRSLMIGLGGLILLLWIGGLVNNLWPTPSKLEIIEWYSSNKILGWSNLKDRVFVVVKSRVQGKYNGGMANDSGILIDSSGFQIVTSSGKTFRGEGFGFDSPTHTITLTKNVDVDIPAMIFFVPLEEVKKGGLIFRTADLPEVELSEDKRRQM